MEGWLRGRALVDQWFVGIVVVLVLVALAGGWLAYQGHVDPGTTTERRTVSSWSTTGTVNHSATVTSENPVYPVGQTLRDRDIYFTDLSPVLNGTFSFGYDASDGGNLDIEVTRRTVLRSVQTDRERTVEVWQQTREVENRSFESVEAGSTVRMPFSVDMNRTQNVTERVGEALGNPPGQTKLSVNTTVTLAGTVNDRRVNRTETARLVVEFDDSSYRVITNETTEQYETTRTVEVPREPGAAKTVAGPLLAFMGLLGVAGLVTARVQNHIALTEGERERLAYQDDREDFDEWISTIRLPDEVADRPRARAESLGHLVNFAIDTDNGVIRDPDRGLYCVVRDEYLYTYRPPAESDLPMATTGSPQSENAGSTGFDVGSDRDEREPTDDGETGDETGTTSADSDRSDGGTDTSQ